MLGSQNKEAPSIVKYSNKCELSFSLLHFPLISVPLTANFLLRIETLFIHSSKWHRVKFTQRPVTDFLSLMKSVFKRQ